MKKSRWNRRQFLSTAALAASWAAAPKSGRANPTERIGVGMIGTGRIARPNLKFFLESPDAQVLAVCDVDAWRMENARQEVDKHYGAQARSGRFQGCSIYRDFRELLSRPDIDAVMISTPDHWHVPMSLAAVAAGKDVCCEKPLTRSIAEGRTLAEAVRQQGRVFRTDSEFRSLPDFHRACELVRNGRIGRLRMIRVGVPFEPKEPGPPHGSRMPVPEELDYEQWLGPAPRASYTEQRVHPRHGYGRPGWMRILDYCDGMITNWGGHLIDVAQWGNNSDRSGPVEVEGRGRYPVVNGIWNVLEEFEIHYRYADGVRMVYRMESPYVRFEGEEGWIHVQWSEGLKTQPESLQSSVIGNDEVRLPLKHEKTDFLEAVKTRAQTLEDAEVGHRTSSVCHLGHIALRLGRKLRWDPGRETFPEDDEANRFLSQPVRFPVGGIA